MGHKHSDPAPAPTPPPPSPPAMPAVNYANYVAPTPQYQPTASTTNPTWHQSQHYDPNRRAKNCYVAKTNTYAPCQA